MRGWWLVPRLAVAAILPLSGLLLCAPAQGSPAPLPDIHQLMHEVEEHQKQVDKLRENYTYTASRTMQETDSSGRVKKSEIEELDVFFVNGHPIERTVKKDGQPLNEHEDKKETERVTRLVERAQKTPRDEALQGPTVTISRLLEIMEVKNPRRQSFRGRQTLVFDFEGRKDAKTHGLAEDMSKKVRGTIWIDEADLVVSHLEVVFEDNFHFVGGLVATIDKGSNFHFDQAPVNGELWLPTGGEGRLEARVLLFKNFRGRFTERDYDYKHFNVEARPGKETSVVPGTGRYR